MHHEDITPAIFERFWSKVDTSAGVNGCWPRPGAHNRGYPIVSVHRWPVRGNRFAYVSIFGDLPPHLPLVLHKCSGGGNPWCVNPAHLAPGTRKENTADAIREGHVTPLAAYPRGGRHWSHTQPERRVQGERHGCARLTEAQVLEIRARYQPRVVTRAMLAREYGVGEGAIKAIVNRKTWRHLTPAWAGADDQP